MMQLIEPISRKLIRLGKLYQSVLAKHTAYLDVNQYHYILSLICYYDGQLSQKALAEMLGKDKSAMVNIINLLTKKGFVFRENNPNDRREQLLKVTEKAKEAVAECELHSPADGVVLTRDIHQGDKVEESNTVMTVAAELTKLAVSLTPEPRVLARIRAGQHAFVRGADAELAGEVHEIRGADVIVWFTAPEAVTKLGTAAQVRIVF